MSLRDELIEVAAMALAEPYLGAVRHPAGVMHEPWRGLVPAATAALDAILARLREPSEEMLRAAHNAGDDYAFGDQIAWNEIPIMWQAMLSTLEPKT
jgi:hypothetical protein